MPVLDLQMCVEDSAIKYEFFEKPCASHYRTVFWQMTDMEYLYGLRGIRYGVLSIEYSYSTSLQ